MSASTPQTQARKLPSTAWQPGQSGNPRGRPRAPFDIAAMCREHAAEAVATLVEALKDPRHKVAAAEALLDRGFGKPRQVVETTDGASPGALHFLAASLVSAELRAELGQRGGRPAIDGRADAVEPAPADLLAAPLPLE